MKALKKRLIIAMSLFCLVTSGWAFAQTPEQDPNPNQQPQQTQQMKKQRGHHRGGGLGGVLGIQFRDDMYQARIAAIAELSGQSVEAIQEKLKTQSLRSITKELDIERDAMREKMQAAMPELVKKAAADGRITAEQESIILERLEENPDGFFGRGGKGKGRSQRGSNKGSW